MSVGQVMDIQSFIQLVNGHLPTSCCGLICVSQVLGASDCKSDKLLPPKYLAYGMCGLSGYKPQFCHRQFRVSSSMCVCAAERWHDDLTVVGR